MRTRGQAGRPKPPEKTWCGECGCLLLADKRCAAGHAAPEVFSEEEATVLRTRWLGIRDADAADAKPEALGQAERRRVGQALKDDRAQAAAQALKDEVEKHEPPAHHFRRAREGGESPLAVPYQRIVEKVFVEDPEGIYDRLEAGLRLGERRSDHGALMQALDEAESHARLAHRLMITAKLEAERWELENKAVLGAMREEAIGALQREKNAVGTDGKPIRSKQITDADADYMAAVMYPEGYGAQVEKRRRLELTVRSLENLVDRWDSRCRSLQVMLGKAR